MEKYKFTLVGNAEEWIDADEMQSGDGEFRFLTDGAVIRTLYSHALEGPPTEREDDGGTAWDEVVRRSDLLNG